MEISHDRHNIKARLALAVVVAFVATPALYGSQAAGAPRDLPTPTPSNTPTPANVPRVSAGPGTVPAGPLAADVEELRAT